MEYYNIFDLRYSQAIRCKHRHYRIKLELLGFYENVIGEIERDISNSSSGQININNQQLTRRSCTLNLINIDKQYNPDNDGLVWYRRKFRLWIGVVVKSDIYWWSLGVFVTTEANMENNGSLSLSAVDKGGILDGSTGENMTDTQYIISYGSTISEIVRDTLLISTDKVQNMPIDPVPPIIDIKYNNIKTQQDISIDSGNYIGNLLTETANNYNADIYYDRFGRMVFSNSFSASRTDGYKYMAHQWDFSDDDEMYQECQYNYNFNAVNAITVYTDSSELENVSYTAYNKNPVSPVCIDKIGIHRKESEVIAYTETSKEKMLERCKEYADYLLLQEALQSMQITFKSPVMPHIDVNGTIGITDKYIGLNQATFVVQSITIPLSSEKMTISAVNINYLPNNMSVER